MIFWNILSTRLVIIYSFLDKYTTRAILCLHFITRLYVILIWYNVIWNPMHITINWSINSLQFMNWNKISNKLLIYMSNQTIFVALIANNFLEILFFTEFQIKRVIMSQVFQTNKINLQLSCFQLFYPMFECLDGKQSRNSQRYWIMS